MRLERFQSLRDHTEEEFHKDDTPQSHDMLLEEPELEKAKLEVEPNLRDSQPHLEEIKPSNLISQDDEEPLPYNMSNQSYFVVYVKD